MANRPNPLAIVCTLNGGEYFRVMVPNEWEVLLEEIAEALSLPTVVDALVLVKSGLQATQLGDLWDLALVRVIPGLSDVEMAQELRQKHKFTSGRIQEALKRSGTVDAALSWLRAHPVRCVQCEYPLAEAAVAAVAAEEGKEAAAAPAGGAGGEAAAVGGGGEVTRLQCGHLGHRRCLAAAVETVAAEKECYWWDTGVLCASCQQPLSHKDWDSIFGAAAVAAQQCAASEAFAAQFEAAEAKRAAAMDAAVHFDCLICMDETHVEESMTLQCGHRTCKDCGADNMEALIREGKVMDDVFICPHQGCDQVISPFEVQSNVDDEWYQKFLRFSLQKNKAEDTIDCPRCPMMMVVNNDADLDALQCLNPNCKHTFCGRCGEDVHEDSTCEQFAKWKAENDAGEQKFQALVRAENWRQCPACKNMAEKKDGCNFMYCVCKANFCYHCGRWLTERQHHSHFSDGAYGKACYQDGKDKRGHFAYFDTKKCDCVGCGGQRRA